jgi:hypothetical protein
VSVAEALWLAGRHGIHVDVSGADLILEADQAPPPSVLDAIRRHKAGIVALLASASDTWTAEDWQAFFDERAGIGEHDGGLSRAEAEAQAFECCIIEWLNRHPEPSYPGRCAWCGRLEPDDCALAPYGIENHGPTWLHDECWQPWHQDRRRRAAVALMKLGMPELGDRR